MMTAPRPTQSSSPVPDGLARLSYAVDEPAERQWFISHAGDDAEAPTAHFEEEGTVRMMTEPAETEILLAESPAHARWTMATAPEPHPGHVKAARLRRQARQVLRPLHFLRVESASLVELMTSYFMLRGAGAMQGTAGANRPTANLFVPIPRNTMPALSAAPTPRVLFCPEAAALPHRPAAFAFPSLYPIPIS